MKKIRAIKNVSCCGVWLLLLFVEVVSSSSAPATAQDISNLFNAFVGYYTATQHLTAVLNNNNNLPPSVIAALQEGAVQVPPLDAVIPCKIYSPVSIANAYAACADLQTGAAAIQLKVVAIALQNSILCSGVSAGQVDGNYVNVAMGVNASCNPRGGNCQINPNGLTDAIAQELCQAYQLFATALKNLASVDLKAFSSQGVLEKLQENMGSL